MINEQFDFYNTTHLKSYDLNKSIRYQLNLLSTLDVYTRKHSENVAAITCRLCEYLHCSKNFTIYCTICAYLHDIGKLFIPPEILQKNGPLTDEEFETMKTHTTIGYNMCMKDLELRPYAAGPLYHHEALNGTGYPNHLTKKDIPYEGQIIRIADEFDALVSKRQYKSHIGITDALNIMIENAHPKAQALSTMAKNAKPDANAPKGSILAKYGKNNPKILKVLFLVVQDDILYEISCVEKYIDDLKNEIDRLKEIDTYAKKMQSAKNESKKNYYLNGINILLNKNETLENYLSVLTDYQKDYETRKKIIDNLFEEYKKVKKLKV